MMKVTVLVTMAMMAVGLSTAFPHQIPYQQAAYQHQPLMPYQFQYGVHDPYTGNKQGRQETSDGKTVYGSYSVDLPDGRKQTVNYSANKYTGFNADVIYTGQAYAPQY